MTDTIQSRRREAAQRGERHFTPPKPCNRCGDTTRYVSSNQCVTCSKERAAKATENLRSLLKKGGA